MPYPKRDALETESAAEAVQVQVICDIMTGYLGEEHQIVKPNLITGMTAYGEFTKPGSQVEGMKTPQFWDDPLLHVLGSCKPEWLPR